MIGLNTVLVWMFCIAFQTPPLAQKVIPKANKHSNTQDIFGENRAHVVVFLQGTWFGFCKAHGLFFARHMVCFLQGTWFGFYENYLIKCPPNKDAFCAPYLRYARVPIKISHQ